MKLDSDSLRAAFDRWIGTVADAVAHTSDALSRPRTVDVEGTSDGYFRVAGTGERLFCLRDGALLDQSGASVDSVLRDARVALNLPPDMFLFRDLDFPSKAVDFLDGVLRAQIDRLTPWSPAQAVYGHSAPTPAGLDRIKLVLAAAALAQFEPIVHAIAAAGANSVAIAARRECDASATPIIVYTRAFQRDRWKVGAQRGLRHVLVGALAFAGLTAAASGILGAWLESRTAEVAGETRSWRQAQMSGARDPDMMLHRRKFESPLAVLVLDQLARILPDDTYLSEMQLAEGKVEIAGVSADATRLVAMLERSLTFSNATFSAPTTHAPNQPGDQFHIQAQVNARYRQEAR
ncbi:MAG: PilN domain-containing protein [Rhodoblastus sp.]|nr:PilN domain-containing protein [Rhodoblastus sp.]